MPTIGQELRRERELRGVSLADIAKITKIKMSSLQALEADKLNILPGEFFIKGMIRAYAKVIGLDEGQVVTLYEHTQQQKVQDQVYERKRHETTILKSHKPNTSLVVIAAVIVVAVSVLIVLGFGLKKGAPGRVRSEARAASAVKALPATAPAKHLAADKAAALPAKPQASPAPPATAPASPAQLNLVIDFQEETWIQVTADGRTVLARTGKAGERVTLTCQSEFILDTGNAGGFRYSLNGRAGKPLGAPGAVVRNVHIGLQNFRDYLGAN